MDCIETWGDIYNIIKYNGEISHHFTILKFNIKQNDFILINDKNANINGRTYKTLFISNNNFNNLKNFLVENYFSSWYHKEPLYHSITYALFENRNNLELYYLLLFDIILYVLEKDLSTTTNIDIIKNLYNIIKKELLDKYNLLPEFQIYNKVKRHFLPSTRIGYTLLFYNKPIINNSENLIDCILLIINDIMCNNKLLAIYNYDDIFKEESEKRQKKIL